MLKLIHTKRIALLIIFMCTIINVNGQGLIVEPIPSHFVFKTFKKGVVKKKSGQEHTAMLNYNTVTQEMVFENMGEKMTFENIDDIDTVFIEGRIFIPYKRVFYEVIAEGVANLYVQHKCDLMSKGKDIGYGDSQIAVGQNYTAIIGSANLFELELHGDYYVNEASVFWVKRGDEIKNISNNKKFLKMFPEKKAELAKYIKENKLKVKEIRDLAKLVFYCNELYE